MEGSITLTGTFPSGPTGMRLVYLSPVPLASFAQRPHHFVHWFHERFDAQVTWIEPYPARLPRTADLQRLRRHAGPPLGPDWRDAPWIRALRPRALPFEPLAAGRWINRQLWESLLHGLDSPDDARTWIVAGKPCALAIELFRRHPRALKVFDVMDNVPAFASGRSRRWLERAEAELAAGCDRLVVSATPLAQRFPEHAGKLICVSNGLTPPARPARSVATHAGSSNEPVRNARLEATGAVAPPQVTDIEAATETAAARDGLPPGRTVFGYLGAIASWFDWDAVTALALRFPQAVVRLIGPCERRPARLPSNVELLPGIPQDRVYDALAGFSFGLIPFRIDPLTDCVDPVKYYEYRAMGLPVLSTRFGEMRLRGLRDQVAFLDELDRLDLRALAHRAADPAVVKAFRAANTWARRFEPLSAWARASGER